MDPQDRRRSKRINWKGAVHLITPAGLKLAANIAEMSEDGWGIHLGSPLDPGVIVGIEGMGFEGKGVVRHCTPCPQGYRLGLQLQPPSAH